MRARKLLAWVGGVVLAVGLWLNAGGVVLAQAPTQAPTQAPLHENPYGFQLSLDEQKQYREAVVDCSTPSLECLVHNVSRFTAMEWINEIAGPQVMCQAGLEDENCPPPDESYPATSQGAIGGIGNLISVMYQHPVANTGTYVADVLRSAHIATPAYAQGLGFAALDPILALWKTFRNISYLFFIIIFVVIGFMIMFRRKLGNAAITAQQAIPSILVALIFVTFSYAIAGLFIDMMYLAMVLIIGVFGETFQGAGQNVNILSFNILNLIGVMFRGVTNVGNNINIIDGLLENLVGSNALTTIVSILGGLTLSLVLAIAVLIGSVKLFFELLRSYATVVLSVVTAPIILMMGAIPGRNAFVPWMKTVAGNLLPFPTVLMVLVMYYKFTDGTIREGGGFMPPFLLGGGQGGTIVAIMGLAIILALPEIVKKVRESVAPKGGFGEFVTNAGLNQFKQGIPMGGRIAALTAGGGLDAGQRLIRNIPKAILTRNPTELMTGVKDSYKRGVTRGVGATSWLSQSVGANQPDILNIPRQWIDKRFATEKMRKSENLLDFVENASQRAGLDAKDVVAGTSGTIKK